MNPGAVITEASRRLTKPRRRLALFGVRRWVIKAAVQKALSISPGGARLNAWMQQHITHSLKLDQPRFENGAKICRKHLENCFRIRGSSEPGFSVLELGTGYDLLLPIGMFLCGASCITTVDIRSHLSKRAVLAVLTLYSEYAREGTLTQLLPWADSARAQAVAELVAAADELAVTDMLQAMRITPVIGDVRNLGLPSAAFDLIFSNTTLQHIPEPALVDIFTEFARLAARSAGMSHYISMADGFAGFDPSTRPYNFLRFSKSMWRWIDSSLVPHNRLRLPDYRRIHGETRWTVEMEEGTCGSLDDLRSVPLADEFRAFSEADLLVLWVWMVSRRPGSP